jgi:hypothetical protein
LKILSTTMIRSLLPTSTLMQLILQMSISLSYMEVKIFFLRTLPFIKMWPQLIRIKQNYRTSRHYLTHIKITKAKPSNCLIRELKNFFSLVQTTQLFKNTWKPSPTTILPLWERPQLMSSRWNRVARMQN